MGYTRNNLVDINETKPIVLVCSYIMGHIIMDCSLKIIFHGIFFFFLLSIKSIFLYSNQCYIYIYIIHLLT